MGFCIFCSLGLTPPRGVWGHEELDGPDARRGAVHTLAVDPRLVGASSPTWRSRLPLLAIEPEAKPIKAAGRAPTRQLVRSCSSKLNLPRPSSFAQRQRVGGRRARGL